MKVSAQDLIGKGYLASELPPPFSSSVYAGVYKKLFPKKSLRTLAKGNFYASECTYFSIPKASFNRRILGIPNPLHYSILSETLADNLPKINKALKSEVSCSTPIQDPKGIRAVKQFRDFAAFRRYCFLISAETSYELKIDISRYYATIYTHIIPWALHTRAIAKKKKNDKTLLGNIIDTEVRSLQSGQTMGIPIGPDASLIISELIGTRLDACIREKFPRIKAARYVDDYYLYFSKRADAEKALKYIQSLFSDYLLAANEEKTSLKEFPFSTDPSWLISLRSLKATCFKDSSRQEQESDIRQFFSAAFDWAEKFPKDEVMKFTIRHLLGIQISDKNWDYFQGWLIKMGLYDPYTLPEICLILFTNRKWTSKRVVKSFVNELLEKHSSKRHSFEIAWTLWLAKIFNIRISKTMAVELIDINDPVPTLMVFDLMNCGLISKKIKTSALRLELQADALNDGRWIFAYEAVSKGWLKPVRPNTNFIQNHPFFSKISKSKISFYDASAKPRTGIPMRDINKKSRLIRWTDLARLKFLMGSYSL